MNSKYDKILTNITLLSLGMIPIIIVAYVFSFNNEFDLDILWHLKIGEDILSKKEIFLENTYTWLPNTYWTQQEWLFDILLYTIVSKLDVFGFYFIHLFAQFLLIYLSIRRNKYHYNLLMVISIMFVYVSLPLSLPNRPIEYSGFIFILCIYLYDKKFKAKPLIYFLIGIFISNFHCGSCIITTSIMIMMFVFDLLLKILFRTKKDEIDLNFKFTLQYAGCMLFYVIGLCMNPYGVKQVIDMFTVNHMSTTESISEWLPFRSSNYLTWIVVFIIAYSLGYAIHSKKWNLKDLKMILILSAFLVLSFTSIKAFMVFYYLYIIYGLKYFDKMLFDFITMINVHCKTISNACNSNIINNKFTYLIIFLSLTFLMTESSVSNDNINNINRLVYHTTKDSVLLDEDSISFLKTIPDDSKIFHAYCTGNYLLYNDIKCFVDTRQFPYAKEFGWSHALDDLFELSESDIDNIHTLFSDYDFNYAISNNEFDLELYMRFYADNEWKVVYNDEENNIKIWKKSNN